MRHPAVGTTPSLRRRRGRLQRAPRQRPVFPVDPAWSPSLGHPSAMPDENPWAPWGIVRSFRDGRPIVTETQLWQLAVHHPEVLDRAGPDELYLHLDQPYRVVTLPDRA